MITWFIGDNTVEVFQHACSLTDHFKCSHTLMVIPACDDCMKEPAVAGESHTVGWVLA